MLKIHSFLHRMKKSLCKLLPQSIVRYKNQMAVVSYTMATVLILISPDYIYGTGDGKTVAKAEITHFTLGERTFGNILSSIEEETDNEAVVRVRDNNPNNKFILYDFKNGEIPSETQEYLTGEFTQKAINAFISTENAGIQNSNEDVTDTINNSIISSKLAQEENLEVNHTEIAEEKEKEDTVKADSAKEEKIQEEKEKDEKKANSNTDRADAKEADSSEADKKEQEDKKYVIELTKDEKEILQRIVEAEATGEDIKGKILVANVIMNRVKDENFPDTIKEVVFQKEGNTYQFSPIKDKRYWSVKISKDTITAVDRVMQGEDYSEGALYFSARARAKKTSMRWFDNNLEYLFKYGGHEFFKNK